MHRKKKTCVNYHCMHHIHNGTEVMHPIVCKPIVPKVYCRLKCNNYTKWKKKSSVQQNTQQNCYYFKLSTELFVFVSIIMSCLLFLLVHPLKTYVSFHRRPSICVENAMRLSIVCVRACMCVCVRTSYLPHYIAMFIVMKSNSINILANDTAYLSCFIPTVHNKIILSYSHISSCFLSFSLSQSIAQIQHIFHIYVVAIGDKQPFSVPSNAAKVRQHASYTSEMVSVRAAHTLTHTHKQVLSTFILANFFLCLLPILLCIFKIIIGIFYNYKLLFAHLRLKLWNLFTWVVMCLHKHMLSRHSKSLKHIQFLNEQWLNLNTGNCILSRRFFDNKKTKAK